MRHTVLDGDLDVSVDLGKAVALAPTPKSRLTSPIPPDFLSLVRDLTHIPPIESRARQGPSFSLYEYITPMRALNVICVLFSRHRSCLPKSVAAITVVPSSRSHRARCNSEEAGRVPPKRIHGSGGVKTEYAYQDEKGSA